MADQDQVMNIARERAERRIDEALGDLRTAAREIATRHGIPDGIAGHAVEELLGRIAYVPSMARDLRRATGQALAKQELERAFERDEPSNLSGEAPDPVGPVTATPVVHPSTVGASVPMGLDLTDLDGVTVQTVRALKAAGLRVVGDVVNVPDEHLLKLNGIADKSLAQLRTAIAKASTPKARP